MKHFFESVISERFHVETWQQNHHLERDEIYNHIQDCVLLNNHINIQNLTVQRNRKLKEANYECSLAATFDKLIMLVVCKLHDIHTDENFRVQH